MAGDLAPSPRFEENAGTNYERKMGNNAARRGPLRFEEGLATDSDIPSDFAVGVMSGYKSAPGRPNHNAIVWEKYPEETMRQRAHVGSATWVEAPDFLGEFSHGTGKAAELHYEEVVRNGHHQDRVGPAVLQS